MPLRQPVLDGGWKQINFISPDGLEATHESPKLLINITNYITLG
jgi:hypothetical protein